MEAMQSYGARHKGISETDRVMFELRTLIEVIHLGGVYDQLNLASLASFESAAQRVHSIVDAYSAGAHRIGEPLESSLGIVGLMTLFPHGLLEEVELAQARAKMRDGKRGLMVEDAAEAVADGSLQGDPRQKPGPSLKAVERLWSPRLGNDGWPRRSGA